MITLGIDFDDLEAAIEIVKTVPVVNDACERSVQMASLFNNKGPKTEDNRQDYYLTIDNIQQRHLKTVSDYNNFYAAMKKNNEVKDNSGDNNNTEDSNNNITTS